MARGRAISGFRDTKLYLTAAGSVGAAAVAAPIDAYKAIVNQVAEIEAAYNSIGFTDLSAAAVVCTGTNPNEVHVWTVTTTVATGVYVCVYVESVPSAADVS